MDLSSIYPEEANFIPEEAKRDRNIFIVDRSQTEPIHTHFSNLEEFIKEFLNFNYNKTCIERVLCCIKPSHFEILLRLNTTDLNIEYKNNIVRKILDYNMFEENHFENLSIVKVCLIACILENQIIHPIINGNIIFLKRISFNIEESFRLLKINKQLLPTENVVSWFFRCILIFIIDEVRNNGPVNIANILTINFSRV